MDRDQASSKVLAALEAIEGAVHLTEVAADEIERGDGGREVALAKTNLEQAEHWLDAAIRKIG